MNLFDGYDSFSGGRLSKRLMAALLTVCLVALLTVLAACGGDDDDGNDAESGSPTQTGASSASGTGSAVTATAPVTPTPINDGSTPTPEPIVEGVGTAIIGGVQYDFDVNSCAILPTQVVVIGGGLAPDGRPFLATITWYEQDYLGNVNAIEMGIGTNAETLFDLPEKVYKLGNFVPQSTLATLELDPTAFSVTATGNFIDLQATEDPPVEGSFTISCTTT